MFSLYFTIWPLLLSCRQKFSGRLILAPRGMLKQSALGFKKQKKKLFLLAFRLLGLHKNIYFHATDQTELEDIRHQFGKQVPVSLLSNFPAAVGNYPGTVEKQPGLLKMIFIGRIHPIKNLHFLLQQLRTLEGTISLTVVGNEEESGYVKQVKQQAAAFPANIEVVFSGERPNEQLPALLAEHHIFVLPTKGENFGHAIFEALRAGRPVLISDQTPWRNLQPVKAGWDLSLNQPTTFVAALKEARDMDQATFNSWSFSAWQYLNDSVNKTDLKTGYKQLFS